jgi:hypothetical protein
MQCVCQFCHAGDLKELDETAPAQKLNFAGHVEMLKR